MAWYDLEEIADILDREKLKVIENKKDKVLKRDRKLYISFMERQYVRISILDDLIQLPRNNELLRLVTQQNFNAFALFLFILKKEKPIEVYLTTYSIDKQTVKGLGEILANNPNLKLTFVMASLLKHDKPKLRNELIDYAHKYKYCQFVEVYNHTKIIAVRTTKNSYVIEGSGNLSANARIESYLFDNNKGSFIFHKNWIDDIINEVKGTEVLKSKKCIIIKNNNDGN